MMGFVILFSDCPETHTYVISLPGYMMCYFCVWKNHTLWDKVLFWGLVVLGVALAIGFIPVSNDMGKTVLCGCLILPSLIM